MLIWLIYVSKRNTGYIVEFVCGRWILFFSITSCDTWSCILPSDPFFCWWPRKKLYLYQIATSKSRNRCVGLGHLIIAWVLFYWMVHITLQPMKYTHNFVMHDDIVKWKHFPSNWPFVRGIHRPLVNSPHKGQWHGAFDFSLICACINGWVNNGGAGNLRRYPAHYDITVMVKSWTCRQCLTHWGRDKGNTILQTTFTNKFSCMLYF